MQPCSLGCLEYVRAKRGALRIEFDAQIARERLPDHLIVPIQHNDIGENAHQDRFVGHIESGSHLFYGVHDVPRGNSELIDEFIGLAGVRHAANGEPPDFCWR